VTLTELFIIGLIYFHAIEQDVNPHFAMAVATVESRTKNKLFRTGKIGKTYAGPMGLHIAYVRDKFNLDATDLNTNIYIGVRALRGKDEKRVLRRYNKEFNIAYYKAVQRAKKDFRRRLQ